MARAPFKLRSQGSPFKEVGSTPKTEINLRSVVDKVKGSLSRLDENIQDRAGSLRFSKILRQEDVAYEGAESPDGLTDFQRRMADKKAQRESGGKSKYQRDIIKKQADRKAKKPAETTVVSDEAKAKGVKRTEAHNIRYAEQQAKLKKKEVVTPEIVLEKTPKKDKRPSGSSDSYMRKHKTGKYRPGSATSAHESMVKVEDAIEGDYYRVKDPNASTFGKTYQFKGGTYGSPIDKKSPYKKGLGSYAKKAKGNRGYKIKRK